MLLDFLISYIRTRATRGPVLVVVEDLQWVDPSTLELLNELVAVISIIPVMLLATARPQGVPTLVGDPVKFELEGLDDAAIEAIARGMDESARLTDSDFASIVSQVDGLPLFAEELTVAALERSPEHGHGELPATIEASIAARLDSLGEAKAIACMGAVLGREFDRSEIEVLSNWGPARLESAVERLLASGLVLRTDEGQYRFRHALVQDVAYGSMLRETKRSLHELAAREVLSEAAAARSPELVAHHLTLAGQIAEAVEYWSRAGRIATSRSANAEAIADYQRAVELLGSRADIAERDLLLFRIHVAMTAPVIAEYGYTSEELATCIEAAMTLSPSVGHSQEVFSLLYSRWASLLTSGSVADSLRTAEEFSELAERTGGKGALLARHRSLGASRMCLGHLREAMCELDMLVAGYHPEMHVELAVDYGVDLLVAGLCFRSETRWLTGDFLGAQEDAQRGIAQARQTGHINSVGMALHFCSLLALLDRDPQAILTYAEETAQLASQHSLGAWPMLIGACAGWAKVTDGNTKSGLTSLIGGVERVMGVGVSMFVPFFQCRLAEVYMNLHDPVSAERWVSAGEILVARTGEVCYKGELRRLRGELLWESGNIHGAERCYQDGLQLARSQGAVAVGLRVATTYAQRLTSAGEPDRGRAMLGPVLGLLAAGPQTPDVRAAHQALAAVASAS